MELALAETVDVLYERAYEAASVDVFRFLLAWTNDWSAAEDLTQEAFIRLWQHRNAVSWDRPILAWLLVVARRLASNRHRSLRRRFVHWRTESSTDEDARVRWLDVKRALSQLTEVERTAIVMTSVEGWSYADLARVLGTTDAALRAAVSRARDKLEAA